MSRAITRIIVHCSATGPEVNVGAEEIRRWHVEGNGWSDIGYHYVIRRGGAIDIGRPEDVQGAHTRGQNEDSLGICLVGGVDKHGEPDANFTHAQLLALAELVQAIRRERGDIPVHGHREFSAKACPSFDAPAWAATLDAHPAGGP